MNKIIQTNIATHFQRNPIQETTDTAQDQDDTIPIDQRPFVRQGLRRLERIRKRPHSNPTPPISVKSSVKSPSPKRPRQASTKVSTNTTNHQIKLKEFLSMNSPSNSSTTSLTSPTIGFKRHPVLP